MKASIVSAVLETSVKTFKEPPNLHEEEGDGVEDEICPRVNSLENVFVEIPANGVLQTQDQEHQVLKSFVRIRPLVCLEIA